MRPLFGVMMLVVLGCEPGGPRGSRPGPRATLDVSAQTVLSEPVAGAFVSLGPEQATTDEQGQTSMIGPIEGGAELRARCPKGYVGTPLKKKLPQALLQSGERLSYELICDPERVDLAIAVMSHGCGPLIVFLDGERLGTTEEGYLHVARPAPSRTFVELTATPLEDSCILRESALTVELDPHAPAAWAVFEGEASKPSPSRANRRTAMPTNRPYRL